MTNKLGIQLPIFLILVPLCSIFLSSILRKHISLTLIAITSSAINLAITLKLGVILSEISSLPYVLGGFNPPIGIEFKIDYLNYPFIFLINLVFFLFFLFGGRLLESQIFSITQPKKIWIIYSLLLLSQVGLLGISATADLFNLYVFIEITSLSAYALFSLGKDRRAVVGAFNYLILGTIGATLILIGIGLILAITGSLNMSDIKLQLHDLSYNKALNLGIAFYITGSLLKVALVPLNGWMVKAYEYSAPIILAILAGISNSVGFYLIIRFLYGVLDYKFIYQDLNIGLIFELFGIITILIASLVALLENSLKRIMIFSTLTHIGYLALCLAIMGSKSLEIVISYLVADVILKTSLFIALAILEDLKFQISNLDNIAGVARIYPTFSLLLVLNLLHNMGLPPTIQFFNKLNLMQVFANNGHVITLTSIIIASFSSLFYNYKIISAIYFADRKKSFIKLKPIAFSSKFLFYLFSIINIILILRYNDINNFIKLITKILY